MKNLKAINMTESNFEKELKDLFKKYNIESDKKSTTIYKRRKNERRGCWLSDCYSAQRKKLCRRTH